MKKTNTQFVSRPTLQGQLTCTIVAALIVSLITVYAFTAKIYLPTSDWDGPVRLLVDHSGPFTDAKFITENNFLYLERMEDDYNVKGVGKFKVSEYRTMYFWPGFILAVAAFIGVFNFLGRNGIAQVRSQESALYGWVEVEK